MVPLTPKAVIIEQIEGVLTAKRACRSQRQSLSGERNPQRAADPVPWNTDVQT